MANLRSKTRFDVFVKFFFEIFELFRHNKYLFIFLRAEKEKRVRSKAGLPRESTYSVLSLKKIYRQELKPGFSPECCFVLVLVVAGIQESGSGKSDLSASLSRTSLSVLALFCLALESESSPESLPGS